MYVGGLGPRLGVLIESPNGSLVIVIDVLPCPWRPMKSVFVEHRKKEAHSFYVIGMIAHRAELSEIDRNVVAILHQFG